MLTESFPCMILHRRNLACIGCGCPRASGPNGSGTSTHQHPSNISSRAIPSPRFNSPPASVTYYSSSPAPSQSFQAQQQNHLQQRQQTHHQPAQQQQQPQHGQHLTVSSHIGFSQPQPPSPFGSTTSSLPHVTPNPPKSSHPLLTPSGRAFAVGGKVQNISSDPLSPCIMYWPDNEPFPEQGQIRPNNLAGVSVSIVNITFFSTDNFFVC